MEETNTKSEEPKRARGRARQATSVSPAEEAIRRLSKSPSKGNENEPTGAEGGAGKTTEGDDPKSAEIQQRRKERWEQNKKRQLESWDNVKTTEGQSKTGTSGDRIRLAVNYFRVQQKNQWRLYHYHASFEPELKITREKKVIMRPFQGEGDGQLGCPAIFDGHSLYTTKLISPEIGTPIEKNATTKDGTLVKITIKLVAEVEPGVVMYLQFYSIVVRKCFELLKLDLMRRNYYDSTAAIPMENHQTGALARIYNQHASTYDAGLLSALKILTK